MIILNKIKHNSVSKLPNDQPLILNPRAIISKDKYKLSI